MQEQTPDTVLEQQPAAAEPEAAAQQLAADTQQPAEAAAPAKEEAPAQPAEPAAVTVVDIRFRNNAKSYYFDPAGLTLQAGCARHHRHGARRRIRPLRCRQPPGQAA